MSSGRRWAALALAAIVSGASAAAQDGNDTPRDLWSGGALGVSIGVGIAAGIGLSIAIVVAYLRLRSRKAVAHGVQLTGDALRLWARRAPYSSGQDSMLFMMVAVVAASGHETFTKLANQGVFEQHSHAYDADPAGWNKIAETAVQKVPDISPDLEARWNDAMRWAADSLDTPSEA